MVSNILESEAANVGGILTLMGGFGAEIYEIVTMQNVNDILQLALAVGGALFLWYKIQGQWLDNKKKRRDLQDKE